MSRSRRVDRLKGTRLMYTVGDLHQMRRARTGLCIGCVGSCVARHRFDLGRGPDLVAASSVLVGVICFGDNVNRL